MLFSRDFVLLSSIFFCGTVKHTNPLKAIHADTVVCQRVVCMLQQFFQTHTKIYFYSRFISYKQLIFFYFFTPTRGLWMFIFWRFYLQQVHSLKESTVNVLLNEVSTDKIAWISFNCLIYLMNFKSKLRFDPTHCSVLLNP